MIGRYRGESQIQEIVVQIVERVVQTKIWHDFWNMRKNNFPSRTHFHCIIEKLCYWNQTEIILVHSCLYKKK